MLDEQSLIKSKLAKRDELRDAIHHSVGDAESLFSIDSDLLQIITYLLIQLIESMKSETAEDHIQAIISRLDTDVLNTLGLLSESLKDKSLIFPIDVKRKFKSEEDIFNGLKDRYTKTSNHLSDYYDDTTPIVNNEADDVNNS
ncbi:MAG: hypothetical protein EP298_11115 [Gammaproteobacteria bacterium]|nr:MAG: hypothetical protein EP298_11115 [Gammaproteobacteria bacterium]UTW43170.1 hypothetical protein KFE69_03215 [bacterium SCSIO 12844]